MYIVARSTTRRPTEHLLTVEIDEMGTASWEFTTQR